MTSAAYKNEQMNDTEPPIMGLPTFAGDALNALRFVAEQPLKS
jgi:hypothetical protein